MARPAFAPLVMPCGADSGTAVDFVFVDSVADAARMEVDVEGPVGVACSIRTELELGRESEEDGTVDEDGAMDVVTEVVFED